MYKMQEVYCVVFSYRTHWSNW